MRGIWLVLVVLAVATAFGLWRRVTDGRLREISPPVLRPVPVADDAPPVDLENPDAELDVSHHTPSDPLTGGDLSAEELGISLGERATLVQFSSAFCQPCVATRRILGEVAEMVDGVAHIDVDAESHLDLVRRLDIRRTPTVLVLNRSGHIVRRASGAPRKADVIAALGAIDGG